MLRFKDVKFVSFSKAIPNDLAPSADKLLSLLMKDSLNYIKLRSKDVKFVSFSKAIPKDFALASFKSL